MRQVALSLVLACALAAPAAASAPRGPKVHSFDSSKRLSINRMNLVVSNFGSFGYDVATGASGLEYPSYGGKTALFAGGLWLGGETSSETLVTVAEYSFEYTPGVLLPGAPDESGDPRFRVFEVHRWWGADSDTIGWADYVANAAPYGAPTRSWRLPVSVTPDPADSVDVPGPDVSGDRMEWCVYHDGVASAHTNRAGQTAPLGLEVRQTIYSHAIPGSLDHAVFLRFEIVNKGLRSFTRLIPGVWSDPDIGGFDDDLAGYSPDRGLGYAYNGSGLDAQYGTSPPAVGFRLLEMRRNGQLVADHWNAFTKYINGTDPQDHASTFHYLQGLDADGAPILSPLTGFPTRYMVDGDPVQQTGWLDTNPLDRRMTCAAPAVAFGPGDTLTLEVALVGGHAENRIASIIDLFCHADSVKALWDSGRVADYRRGSSGPPPSLAPCGAPPGPGPNCMRSLAYWRDQCAQSDPQYSVANLGRLAHAVDSLSATWDWSDPADLFSLCAVLDAPGGVAATARDTARAEYAAFLCNYLADQLDIAPTSGLPVVMDPFQAVTCAPFGSTYVQALTLPGGTHAEIVAANYLDLVPDHGPPIENRNGGSFLPDGVVFGSVGFGSTLDPLAQPDSFPSVELRFSTTITQKAYRYVRPEDLVTGLPPGGNLHYLYAGHRDVPFTVWDRSSGRQLEVAFLERVVTDEFGTVLAPAFQPATFDSTWGPDSSSTGGREWLWILSTPYQPTPRPAYEVDDIALEGGLPCLYNVFARRVSADAVFDDGDRFAIDSHRFPGASAEDFLVRFASADLADTTNLRLFRAAAECLGSVNRGDVFPALCNDPTPVLASLLEAVADPGEVRVTWYLGGSPALAARLERSEDGAAWNDRGAVAIGGDGYARAADRAISPGARYAYRLAVTAADGVMRTAAVWVDVPRAPAFALGGLRPNPATGERLVVSFSLPSRASAVIELLDLAGRLVQRREVGSEDAGWRVLDLGSSARVAPGVYVIRLRQGDLSLARKAVVVR